ncbi:diguanylate cyclase domain-containing protein [Kaistia terrae]|uniref:Diguanylate cyclase domain-containing protein n=1 Tax=Kaistia terrae TaxID=537017 RepID=A0ABW0PQD3_9HYPH|nr:diguanylate cyclase [Kaistia terrae]MCX5578096.1 diguanylate cyclase [Kaistia terrae]
MQRLLLPVTSFLSGALVYGIAGVLGLWLMHVAGNVPTFWPANGLMVVLILTLGINQIGFALAGATFGGLVVQWFLQSGPMGLALTASDLTEVAIVVLAAERLRLTRSGLETVSSIVALVGILSIATALSALGAAATLAWFRDIDYAESLLTLWRLNAVSALIILAPYFALVRPGWTKQLRAAFHDRGKQRIPEYLAIVGVLISSVLIMRDVNVSMISFFTVPLLSCAIRYGPPATAVTGSILSLVIILLLVAGEWPSASSTLSLGSQLQRIELALSFNTIPPLFVAAAVAGLQRAARELKQSQQRLRYALAGSGEGVWDWCIANNQTYFSDSWYAILGYQRHELEETVATWDLLRHPDDTAENRRRIQDHLEGRTPRYSVEQRFRHKNGHWIWVLDRGSVVEFDADGRPYRAVGTLQDISRRRARQDELDRRAHHDPLTGLANRAALSDSFEKWSAEGRSFCFLLIDLDDFKPINDRFGHQFGDHALLAIADRIRACLGKDDVAARIGGDEFALLIQAPDADAEIAAKRLIERISEPIGFAESVVTTGASIGIARVTDGAPDFESTYRLTDIALYDAKAAGGSTYRKADATTYTDRGRPQIQAPASALPALTGEGPAD